MGGRSSIAGVTRARVLFVAFHFPPIGGGGVQRNAKFARYLPDFGYEPVIVTGPGRSVDRWAPEDETLLGELPAELEVHRVTGDEPPQLDSFGIAAAAERFLMRTPQAVRFWLDGALAVGREVGRDTELIYASLIPYTTAAAAAELARQLGKPWVADLQDPWVFDEMWLYPSALHRARDRRLMRRLLSSAAAIVMNTPESVKRVVDAFPELRSRPVVSIPNGFDGADFRGSVPTRTDGKFRIVHAGYLHTDVGLRLRRRRTLRRLLGGWYTPVDIYTRSHVFLLEAIQSLLERDPSLADTIEFVLAGALTPLDRDIAARYPFTRTPGYVTHDDTLDLVRTADLLFLPMHDLPAGTRAAIVPGKTYEYLATGRPILAAVPDGDARDLLEHAGNAFVCRPSDTAAIAAAVAGCIERWRAGTAEPPPRPEALEPFERVRLTEELAGVFDHVLGRVDAQRSVAVL